MTVSPVLVEVAEINLMIVRMVVRRPRELRFVLVHASIVPMNSFGFSPSAALGRPSDAGGLAERAALVNPPASAARRRGPILRRRSRRRERRNPPPFGRRRARLARAGRTILQIIPRLDAGGAERTTIDVAPLWCRPARARWWPPKAAGWRASCKRSAAC